MTPRNTKQGASANARRASSGVGRSVSPSRTSAVPATRATSGTSATKRGVAKTPRAAAKTPQAATKTPRAAAKTPRAAAKAPRAKKPARRPEPSSWRWWLLPVLVISLSAIFIATYYPVAKVQYRETRERARLRAELEGVRARNDRLAKEVARLKTPEGVEDYARVQLGLVKAGERVGVVVDEYQAEPATITAPSAPVLDSEETIVPPVGPWSAFLDSVFGAE